MRFPLREWGMGEDEVPGHLSGSRRKMSEPDRLREVLSSADRWWWELWRGPENLRRCRSFGSQAWSHIQDAGAGWLAIIIARNAPSV